MQNGRNILIWLGILWLAIGCSAFKSSDPPPAPPPEPKLETNIERRPALSARQNRYEGSLWRDESSFGNLWRDHRARFRFDLLTIKEVGKIITVPAPKQASEQKPQTDVQKASVALEALSLRDTLEEEQNEILRSLDLMSAEVVQVLPNGNMVVRGRRVDNRQNNQVRYLTTVEGILRPADVDDSNIVSATKLAYPEVKIKRQIQGSILRARLQKLAPLIGKDEAGLLERITDFTKKPSGTTSVSK